MISDAMLINAVRSFRTLTGYLVPDMELASVGVDLFSVELLNSNVPCSNVLLFRSIRCCDFRCNVNAVNSFRTLTGYLGPDMELAFVGVDLFSVELLNSNVPCSNVLLFRSIRYYDLRCNVF